MASARTSVSGFFKVASAQCLCEVCLFSFHQNVVYKRFHAIVFYARNVLDICYQFFIIYLVCISAYNSLTNIGLYLY